MDYEFVKKLCHSQPWQKDACWAALRSPDFGIDRALAVFAGVLGIPIDEIPTVGRQCGIGASAAGTTRLLAKHLTFACRESAAACEKFSPLAERKRYLRSRLHEPADWLLWPIRERRENRGFRNPNGWLAHIGIGSTSEYSQLARELVSC